MEFNKVYHTKTMVEILRKQGHMNLALKLTEQILAVQADNQEVLRINCEIKEEIKRTFEKFKRAGQTVRVVTEVVEEEAVADISEDNEVIEVDLATTMESSIPAIDPKLIVVHKQVALLENLLQNIQLRRQEFGKAS